MPKRSSGILMYRFLNGKLKVFVVHPGGPFYKDKDKGVWSIPKGEIENPDEDLLMRAIKEANEEIGIVLPAEKERYFYLGEIIQKSGKVVSCFAIEDNENFWKGFFMKQDIIEITDKISGKKIKIPEVDKADYFSIETAREKLIFEQAEFLDRLVKKLNF